MVLFTLLINTLTKYSETPVYALKPSIHDDPRGTKHTVKSLIYTAL